MKKPYLWHRVLKMKNSNLHICDAIIHPGELANLALPLPEQYSCSPLYMPIKVLHGKTKGPCLVIFSILKGDELNGLEIANRVVSALDPKDISGTVIAVPVLNVYGLTHYPNRLPSGHNLANCFPGDEKGSFGERIAYAFTQEVLKKADCCIELQTGDKNHNILPQIYCNFDNQQARRLARVFTTPVITKVENKNNRLRQTTEDLHIPLLVYQAGEAMRFDEGAITTGIEGTMNIMRALGILAGGVNTDVRPIASRDEEWIVAHTGGVLHTEVNLGQNVKKGDILGTITDPFGGTDFSEPVKAHQEGIIVGINTSPFIYEGLELFKIATFLDTSKAENVIEEWQQQQPDTQAT